MGPDHVHHDPRLVCSSTSLTQSICTALTHRAYGFVVKTYSEDMIASGLVLVLDVVVPVLVLLRELEAELEGGRVPAKSTDEGWIEIGWFVWVRYCAVGVDVDIDVDVVLWDDLLVPCWGLVRERRATLGCRPVRRVWRMRVVRSGSVEDDAGRTCVSVSVFEAV